MTSRCCNSFHHKLSCQVVLMCYSSVMLQQKQTAAWLKPFGDNIWRGGSVCVVWFKFQIPLTVPKIKCTYKPIDDDVSERSSNSEVKSSCKLLVRLSLELLPCYSTNITKKDKETNISCQNLNSFLWRVWCYCPHICSVWTASELLVPSAQDGFHRVSYEWPLNSTRRWKSLTRVF